MATKILLRHIRVIREIGLMLFKSDILDITWYTDVNRAICSDDRRSTSGFCIYLENSIISLLRNIKVSRSFKDVEFRVLACIAVEIM